MEKHIIGGVLILVAMFFYGLTFFRAIKRKEHYITAITAVSFDVLGSLVMSSGSKGIYLIENFERLNIGQIFHLVISPIALGLMIWMLFTGFFKFEIHKKAGKIVAGIWVASMLSGFLMVV